MSFRPLLFYIRSSVLLFIKSFQSLIDVFRKDDIYIQTKFISKEISLYSNIFWLYSDCDEKLIKTECGLFLYSSNFDESG